MWIVAIRLGLAALILGAETISFYYVGKYAGRQKVKEEQEEKE